MDSAILERLSLCHGTLLTTEPPDFVSAAHEAGFGAVSLRVQAATLGDKKDMLGVYPLIGDTKMRRETKTRLDDTGTTLTEAEVAFFTPGAKAESFRGLVESAAYLGCGGVISVFFGHDSEAEVVDQYTAFAELTKAHNLLGLVEFLAISSVKSLDEAVRLIKSAGHKNCGMTMDILHLTRTGGSVEDLDRVEPGLIKTGQINDGPFDFPLDGDNWAMEMSVGRHFLGDGDFPVRPFVDHLPATCPIGIEVISQPFMDDTRSPSDKAQFVMDNAKAYFGI